MEIQNNQMLNHQLPHKKIIIIGPAHPLRPGGITTFNERLCKAFNDSGNQCSIWSFSLQYPSFLFPGTSQFTTAPAPKNINIVTAINAINPLNWFSVGHKIKALKPDLVVVRFWLPFFGPCLGTILRLVKNNGTKIICIADNIVPHEHRPGDKIFTRYFLKPIDEFVVMSNQVLSDLRLFSSKKATLLPHPLYDNFGDKESTISARNFLRQTHHITISDTDLVLVFFGLIRPYKGLDVLIEALSKITTPHVKLLIAGEVYDDEKIYTGLIEKLGLQNNIITHFNFISNEEVRHFICSADCIIQPYKSATQSGVTPVAYHFEVPMIVTNVGGLPDMVPDGMAGIVCEPNATAIAAAIDRFFELGKQQFMPGIIQEKKKLSWERFVQTITT